MYFGAKYYIPTGVSQYGFFNSSGDTTIPMMVINNNAGGGANNGYVGIGVISASSQLHVKTISSTAVGMILDTQASPTGDIMQLKSNGTTVTSVNASGKVITGLPLNLPSYTVATLPAGVMGDIAYVTDALAPSFLATVVGGGAVVTPVFYNGTNWVGY
jgi:hypothetical protein